jgi:hypothetical protein
MKKFNHKDKLGNLTILLPRIKAKMQCQEHWVLRFEDNFFEEPRLPVTGRSEIANINIKSRRRPQALVPTPYTTQPIGP